MRVTDDGKPRGNVGCAKFDRLHLEHHETELRSPSHRLGPTVRIELRENGGDGLNNKRAVIAASMAAGVKDEIARLQN